ncbi:hypothetical protein KBC03_02960 [Patescibacteria group bacterium]|nr:hypothetical protein [Patescibacteria group bacterium]
MQNTLNSNKEEPKTKELHVIKEQIINNDFYMDVFDNEYSTLGKVGTALINGKRYIVASHILNNQHDTLSVETGKQFLDIYYMNTPGLFAFSQQIAERLKINAGNMWVAYGRSGNKYQESAQVQIQTKIASLLAQGYKFDFYQLNATDNEYELAFFAQTFLELPDSAYKDAEISNREYFKEHNVAPLLDTSIRLIKERHINKHPLTIKQENQLKSMIFHKIYLNGTYRGLTAENVLEELHDEIDKELNPPPLP